VFIKLESQYTLLTILEIQVNNNRSTSEDNKSQSPWELLKACNDTAAESIS